VTLFIRTEKNAKCVVSEPRNTNREPTEANLTRCALIAVFARRMEAHISNGRSPSTHVGRLFLFRFSKLYIHNWG